MHSFTVKSKAFAPIWDTMFIYGLGYDPVRSNRGKLRTMLHSMLELLPCSTCRDYAVHVLIYKYPLDFSSREALLYSLYIWKSVVNQKLGKRNASLPQVIKYWQSKLV